MPIPCDISADRAIEESAQSLADLSRIRDLVRPRGGESAPAAVMRLIEALNLMQQAYEHAMTAGQDAYATAMRQATVGQEIGLLLGARKDETLLDCARRVAAEVEALRLELRVAGKVH